MSDEFEVETSLVLKKHIKLRDVSGIILDGLLYVYESEDPYILILLVETEYQTDIKVTIFKEDLARELRLWLNGKYIRNPAALVPLRIDDSVMKFIKFGKPPKQEDLIMWILSRSELYVGKTVTDLIFGGKAENEKLDATNNSVALTNSISSSRHSPKKSSVSPRRAESELSVNQMELAVTARHKGDDLGMFEMTKKLLRKSATLEAMKTSQVKGRIDAKKVASTVNWTDDKYRLCQGIERVRKEIERAMDERRRMIEVAKTRQIQTSDKFHQIRDQIKEQQGGNAFMHNATQELLSLQKMEADIKDDILRQRVRAHRGAQRVFWTAAPSGFANRRGKSMKGPVLGPGPLHPNATSSLKNPRIESTIKKYYWDSAGRRHERKSEFDDEGKLSLVEQAMNAIRRAAANIAAFKLDLKAIFEEFDTSGDGFLSPMEMAQAFLSMGVKLDVPSVKAIFQ